MSVATRTSIAAAVLALWASAGDAYAQLPGNPAGAPTPLPGVPQPGSYQRLTSGNNPALNFYGGTKSLRHRPRHRSTPMPAPLPVQTAPVAKPFSYVQQTSSISPYLALDQPETSTSLPNYLLYVRPRLQQQATNRVQQAQYWQTQQQLRAAQAGGAVTGGPSGGIPTTGHSAQFMNIGGYYPGLR